MSETVPVHLTFHTISREQKEREKERRSGRACRKKLVSVRTRVYQNSDVNDEEKSHRGNRLRSTPEDDGYSASCSQSSDNERSKSRWKRRIECFDILDERVSNCASERVFG